MTNLYYNTVKMLLERIASVMVDQQSLECLVRLVRSADKMYTLASREDGSISEIKS